jgi:predicted dithiol-disulfide oxidoreductase (DUF899 family)
LLDQLDAAALHFTAGGGNIAVVANTKLDRLQSVAPARGWKHLRLPSSLGTTFKRDNEGTIRLKECDGRDA